MRYYLLLLLFIIGVHILIPMVKGITNSPNYLYKLGVRVRKKFRTTAAKLIRAIYIYLYCIWYV